LRIVIVGGRGVGASIAEYFSKRGDDVVVIEGDEELCDRLAKSLDVTVYCGDAKSERLLRDAGAAVSYTHLRAHETRHDLVCRLLLEKKK